MIIRLNGKALVIRQSNTSMPPHLLFFFIGFFYYMVSPIVIGELSMFRRLDIMDVWYYHYELFKYNFGSLSYLFAVSIMAFSFILGSAIGNMGNRKLRIENVRSPYPITTTTSAILICSGLVAVVFLVIYPPSLGSYQDYNVGVFGTLVSVQSLVIFATVLAYSKNYKYRTIFGVVVASILSLHLFFSGVRIALINAFFAWICVRLLSGAGFPAVRLIVIAIISVFIGAMRVGDDFEIDTLFFYLFSESLLTWISASSMLGDVNSGIDALESPAPFFSSIINFIPSFILNGKEEYIINISENVNFSSPFGATNVLVTSLGNFGYTMYWVYAFICGLVSGYAYKISRRSNVYYAYYVCICAFMAFQFFRDGASIFVKQAMWNVGVLPVLAGVICAILLSISPQRRCHAP